MNLPPDKVRLLRSYDNEKKWELICDQVGGVNKVNLFESVPTWRTRTSSHRGQRLQKNLTMRHSSITFTSVRSRLDGKLPWGPTVSGATQTPGLLCGKCVQQYTPLKHKGPVVVPVFLHNLEALGPFIRQALRAPWWNQRQGGTPW